MTKRRHFGDLVLESCGAGHWIDSKRLFAIVHMLAGTRQSEWSAFRVDPFQAFPVDDPFTSNQEFDWSWEEIAVHFTFEELVRELNHQRELSRVLLPKLVAGETMVKFGSRVRLVREIKLDTDCGAILRVQGATKIEAVQFWSTYGCMIAEPYPNLKFNWLGEA
jgi:hypothetical protein